MFLKLSAVPYTNNFMLFLNPVHVYFSVKLATPFIKHKIAVFISLKNKVHLISYSVLEEVLT